MKRLAIMIVAAAFAWSGYWFWSANRLETATETWFSDRQSDGWRAEYGSLNVSGFPNRLDRRMTGLVLQPGAGAVRWTAPFLQTFQLSYQPGHVIVAFPPNQQISAAGRLTEISSDSMRASMRYQPNGMVDRLNLEAEVLNVLSKGQSIALAGVKAATQRLDDAGKSYRVALTAASAATGRLRLGSLTGQDSLHALQLDATVDLDRALNGQDPASLLPAPIAIDLHLFEANMGAMSLKLSGPLTIDAQGRLNGSLSTQIENWRGALDQMRSQKALPEVALETIAAALEVVAQLSGRSDTLDVTLRLDRGNVFFGPVPLGSLAPLALPRLPSN
ncbi:DUF2125 domain-containing protein [Pseudoprimorskyibacter insulae]|uniref:DUF2125 domain-containing protein n=1 Tax=Pseudoprimorskyibacter insulae TaxID=1695997 RepID=A0A2R8ANT8_9RHOB|nr:DUF2125 domain-containing protein [Pseudoprimorskyibacter insulae]SPF77539.1 hypothetical protein PRI8871_00122 [Pseudoprimorskyibacter insulae]